MPYSHPVSMRSEEVHYTLRAIDFQDLRLTTLVFVLCHVTAPEEAADFLRHRFQFLQSFVS